MPEVVTSIWREGEYARLQLALPSRPVHDIGVLLLNPENGRLYFRLRRHWDDLAEPEDARYLAALEDDFRNQVEAMGGRGFLESLEDSLSNILLISQRQAVKKVDSFSRMADQLFEQHVEEIPVERYRTHLPLYSLQAAAGKFGADEEVEEEGWVRVPEGMRLDARMFVAHVKGESMEPRIHHGSLNIFRGKPVGSRQGKIVLVELIGVHERYTVKRYTSKKVFSEDETWEHESIRLEPLNPEFEAFELKPEQIKYVAAEWIGMLE